MTVEELLQKLVDLVREGKAKDNVKVTTEWGDEIGFSTVETYPEENLVLLD